MPNKTQPMEDLVLSILRAAAQPISVRELCERVKAQPTYRPSDPLLPRVVEALRALEARQLVEHRVFKPSPKWAIRRARADGPVYVQVYSHGQHFLTGILLPNRQIAVHFPAALQGTTQDLPNACTLRRVKRLDAPAAAIFYISGKQWQEYAQRIERDNLRSHSTSPSATAIRTRAQHFIVEKIKARNGLNVRDGWKNAMRGEYEYAVLISSTEDEHAR